MPTGYPVASSNASALRGLSCRALSSSLPGARGKPHPATAAHVLDLIARLTREQHLTTVVSLHQVDLAKRYADRVIGLNAGRVVFDGAPSCLTDKALARIYSTSPSRSALQRLAPDDVEDLGPGADHALVVPDTFDTPMRRR